MVKGKRRVERIPKVGGRCRAQSRGGAGVPRGSARSAGRQCPAFGIGPEAATEEAVKGPSLQRLWKYIARCLRLHSYLVSPGDGRTAPQIPARVLLWALLLGRLLTEYAFHAVEASVHSSARRALQVETSFGDDAFG